MTERVTVIGRGRVGRALAARLQARGLLCEPDSSSGFEAGVTLLCVPDAAIAGVARGLAPGAWVAHVSGATPLAHLAPHVKRFSMHPLQTFSRARGPEQIDGAWAAVSGETGEALRTGFALAEVLGLRPFALADDRRALYHAGAVIASNYLVTVYRAAARALEAAGAPPEALVPLMRRTIDNGFDLTGPISRGDWATVDAHIAALNADLPDLVPLYRTLAEATRP
jgi:predicted short-subunit dehydrogenase-like oxidoreductase (DUF2520 family)